MRPTDAVAEGPDDDPWPAVLLCGEAALEDDKEVEKDEEDHDAAMCGNVSQPHSGSKVGMAEQLDKPGVDSAGTGGLYSPHTHRHAVAPLDRVPRTGVE